jgi:hypothetical protein
MLICVSNIHVIDWHNAAVHHNHGFYVGIHPHKLSSKQTQIYTDMLRHVNQLYWHRFYGLFVDNMFTYTCWFHRVAETAGNSVTVVIANTHILHTIFQTNTKNTWLLVIINGKLMGLISVYLHYTRNVSKLHEKLNNIPSHAVWMKRFKLLLLLRTYYEKHSLLFKNRNMTYTSRIYFQEASSIT